MLVTSLPLFLLPKYILGQGSFHLIRSISSLCVYEFEPFNKLIHVFNLGVTASQPWSVLGDWSSALPPTSRVASEMSFPSLSLSFLIY